jgi:hypothetical protein
MRMAVCRNRKTGFTLVDALVACALLTGGLVVVAGALDGLAAADSTTEARVHARELAVSVLAELKGLPIDAVLQYSQREDAPGRVVVELVNGAGQAVALPIQPADLNAFPPQVETRVRAVVKDRRGHAIEVQTVGFLKR